MAKYLDKSLIVLKIVLCLSVCLATEANPPSPLEPSKTMNDITLKEFQGFEKNWHLVTVRYRKDTQEMRWTFANEIAWKALSSGSIEYQENAAFAKIGTVTQEDPQFPSSAVPSGARRYQFMVRNDKKYQSTGGWGYALFDVNGNTFPEPVHETSMACYACHKIVENRGQVFSQPFLFTTDSKALIDSVSISKSKGYRVIEFEWTKTSDLHKDIKKHLPSDVLKIRMIKDSSIRKNLFQGTLDEIRPRLELEAYNFSAPAALISTDGKRFSLVLPIAKDGCKKNRSFRAVSTLPATLTGKEVQTNEYCNP
jgi:hypothetical protein